jgi:MSHA pilin protein MshC
VTAPTSIRAQGFTLVELVTVLIIIAVVSMVAVPRFFDNDAFNERGYADELAASMKLANRMAIAGRCPIQVTANAVGYSARLRTGCGAGAFTQVVRRGDGDTLDGSAPFGVVLAPAAATVLVFNIDGTVSANAAFTIGGFYTVNVAANTGEVTVQP